MRRTETVTVQAEIEHAYSVLSELTTPIQNGLISLTQLNQSKVRMTWFGCSSSKPNWGLSHE